MSSSSSNLSIVEAKLPPGFRFHPRDEELIFDYLMKKVAGYIVQHPRMIEVDLNKCEPWDIPESACVGGKELYFYSRRDRKYATGLRTNRATVSGYWKATGKDLPVLRKGTLVGMRKTLVFYQGRAPKGRKSDWVMHEFRLEGPLTAPPKFSSQEEDWVLCRVFFKNKDIPTKQHVDGTGTGDDVSPSSPSLPALMDPYINFGQTQHNNNNNNNNNNNEQVSCFSIYTTSTNNNNNNVEQTSSQPFSYLTHMDQYYYNYPNFSTKNISMPNLINNGSSGNYLPDFWSLS